MSAVGKLICRRRRCWLLAAVCVAGLAIAPEALADPEPQWTVTAVSAPTNFSPGSESGEDHYVVTVMNTGGAASNQHEPVTVRDVLPAGLTLDRSGVKGYDRPSGTEMGVGQALKCESVTCTFSGVVAPEDTLVLTIPVDVEALMGERVLTNVVRVSGGGAPDASVSTPTAISTAPAKFGIAPGSVAVALSSTQAGVHADLTTAIGFNTITEEGSGAGHFKEVVDDLPPGFAGDLVDTPTCSVAKFSADECPIGTQVGVATFTVTARGTAPQIYTEPVYNLSPEPGTVAKLGWEAIVYQIQGDVTVRPGDYGLQARFQNIPAIGGEVESTSLTIWGIPTASVHDGWRWNPPMPPAVIGSYGVASDNARVPYLSNPTSCTSGPLQAYLFVSSWEEVDGAPVSEPASFGPLRGCDQLTMPSTFVVAPTTQEAYAPTGLDAELGVQQTYENAEGLASAHLNKSVVTLPEGMTINPSAGVGAGACTPQQYAAEPVEEEPGSGCPNDSKLGSVRIQAPAIKEEAFGSVYLATPYDNPFSEPGHPNGSLVALYIVARIPNRGVIVKAAGKVSADPLTGQLTTIFEDLPQLPFTTFTLSFRQGGTSPLVTPPVCGSFTAKAELTPWSNLTQVLLDETPPFAITTGFGGGACPSGGAPPFNPGITAGTLNNDAGAYAPLDLRITRNDGEQEITGFSTQLPPGLTANLTGVPFCSEADITLARTKTGAQEEAEPSCPAASEIGHTLVGAGVGEVLAWTPGKIYMAGPFEGAPFSVVAITSARVGPFDLGTVVVHLPLDLNPVSAAVTIPAGRADQIPHIIDGIVIHVRDIRVYIDRPNFMINPTSCNPLSLSATVIGGGANPANPADNDPVTTSAPFRVTACQALAFKPTLQGIASSRSSRVNGVNVRFRLTFPGTLGREANVAKVRVELPKRLPLRLTTLQKACTESVFYANPASCPAASVVATATAVTPILPVPLTGPVYFVSHGSAKYPELITVLQGYGVTIDLHAETFISKKGVATGTFASVPDDPVDSFELRFPQGLHSAFTTEGSLCHVKLAMPTTFTAQNGAIVHDKSRITVTGCPRKIKHRSKKPQGTSTKAPNYH